MSGIDVKAAANEPLLPVDKTAERPLWVMLIIMAFLAALALLSARIGARNYNAWQSDLQGSATVQLFSSSTDTRLNNAQQALSIIKTAAPDISAARVTDAEALALVEPWLGESLGGALPDGITLPVLIRLSGSSEAQRREIASALSTAGLEAIVDDHSKWSGDITRTARAFETGSWLILLITFFAGTAATVFATQSVMAAQSKTVSVFAQVGAADKFIARLFVMRAVKVGLISGALGAISALGFLALYRLLRGPASSGLLPKLTPAFSDILMLIALALVFAIVCAIAAGVSAKQILEKMRLYS